MSETEKPARDPKKTKQVAVFKHNRPFYSCRFDTSGERCYGGAQDALVHQCDVATTKSLGLEGHQSWVRALNASPDGKRLYTGDYAGNLIFWDLDDNGPSVARKIKAHDGWLRTLAVSPDSQLIATGGNDNLVKIWSAADGKMVARLEGHPRHVYAVTFDPAGKELVSADLMGAVKHWDLADRSVKRELDAKVLTRYDKTFRADVGGVRRMEFSPDGGLLACSGITDVSNAFAGVGKPCVVLFDWKSGKQKIILRPKANFTGFAWGVIWHPDGYLVAVGGGNSGGRLWFFKPDQEKSFHEFKLPSQGYDLDLHPDANRLAVAQYNKQLVLYSLTGA